MLQTRIQSHGRRRDVRAESKEVRRFLTTAMEATNGWPRIRLLRRKNLTSAERGGEGPKLHHSAPENRHHDMCFAGHFLEVVAHLSRGAFSGSMAAKINQFEQNTIQHIPQSHEV